MKKTLMITLIGVLAIILGVVSFSYAYYTFRSGGAHASYDIDVEFPDCVSYSISVNSLSLSGDLSAPIQDYKVLGFENHSTSSLYKTRFSITNSCPNSSDIYVALALNNAVNNSPSIINSIKYAVYKVGEKGEEDIKYTDARFLNDGSNYYTLSSTEVSELALQDISAINAYRLTPTVINGSSFTSGQYDLYLWIGYDENGTNNSTQNMGFSSYLIVGVA